MQKIMISSICLGILLVGIVMIPGVFAETHTVTITSGSDCEEPTIACFVPSVLTIQVGDTVTWTNLDSTDHTVTSDPSGFFDSGFMFEDDSYSYTFNQDDKKFEYVDIIGKFRGTIIVGNPAEPKAEAPAVEEETAPAVEEETKPVVEEKAESAQQTSGGCGPGTVLEGNTCVLAPEESSDGCGPGTSMVNGVCQLDKTKSASMSIDPLYIVIGVAAIGGGAVAAVFAVRRGSSGTKRPKPARQDLEDYEQQYLRRQGQRPRRKPADTIGVIEEFARKKPRKDPAETRQISSSCNSCGKPLKPTAKFCGKCGAKQ